MQHFTVDIHPISTSVNQQLFNSTRKFLKQSGVEYDVDMRHHYIIVNNGVNSSFMLKFEDLNYIRATKIPRGKIEVLFQAGTPEFIIKKLFDFRFLQFYEVNRMILIYTSKPKPMEVIELPPTYAKK